MEGIGGSCIAAGAALGASGAAALEALASCEGALGTAKPGGAEVYLARR